MRRVLHGLAYFLISVFAVFAILSGQATLDHRNEVAERAAARAEAKRLQGETRDANWNALDKAGRYMTAYDQIRK